MGLISLPDYIRSRTVVECKICGGYGLVCEDHPANSWETGTSSDCMCGAPGMPCKCTGIEE